MATVELHVADAVLATFETIRDQIGGRETGRRRSTFRDDVTILDMEMPDAPDGAACMEVIAEWRLHEGTRVKAIDYYAADGTRLT